ncbi:MAG: ISL3 family transposase [Verrucomicrobia bacterium]|nr:ISL3 family transposase [Verrucomicrobiota bacterium]
MNETEEHYARLLGLVSPWKVTRVKLSVEKMRVDIFIEYGELTGTCPECGAACRVYDRSPGRVWRHLDTMRFGTYLYCEPPRTECAEHGIKTMLTPWAGKHSRFTQLFEAFAINVMLASRSLQEAGKLLRLEWHPLHGIMKRAVERGLNRRGNDEIAWIGMDEKSFRKGHDYVSLINDLERSRVLDVVEGREGNAADRLIAKALDEGQREMVCGVAIDMSAPYIAAIHRHLPHADIVHDKFHIAKHLNEAVDKTRRKEHRKLLKNKDERLTGTKYSWLKGMEHLSDESLAQVESLAKAELDVAKAWYIKELFRHFWTRRDGAFARSYFERWYTEALKTGLPEIRKVARMLKKHLENILTYFECYITNAVSEGLNSKIQTIKANARGFRNFENYRVSILFFCGKLELSP